MGLEFDLLCAFETHSAEEIRKALAGGLNPCAPMKGKAPIVLLMEMYTRSPRFGECLRVMLEAGATLNDPLLEALLLDDAARLRDMMPGAMERRFNLECTFTSLEGATPLHVCAEYNAVECAKALIEAGADVNARADSTPEGLNGHTAIFHTVNSHRNFARPMMELLAESGADLDFRLKGVVWGGGFDWETVVFDVTPLSYAQCGLYRQFQRDEEDVYSNIAYLYQRIHGEAAPIRNVPNKYLES